MTRVPTWLALAAITGCRLMFPSYSANLTVAELESFLPVIQELRVEVYMLLSHDDCEYLKYSRGAFTSKPEDEFCRVFDFGDPPRYGGDEAMLPRAFDEQALDDLAALKHEFDLRRALDPYASVIFDAAGSVAPDSLFSFDRCDSYVYWPGWTTLPKAEDFDDDAAAVGLDSDWYKIDGC